MSKSAWAKALGPARSILTRQLMRYMAREIAHRSQKAAIDIFERRVREHFPQVRLIVQARGAEMKMRRFEKC